MDSIELKFQNTWGWRRRIQHLSSIEDEVRENRIPAIYCFQEVCDTSDPARQDAWSNPTNIDNPRIMNQLWPPPQADQYKKLQSILGKTHTGHYAVTSKGNPYPDLPIPTIDFDLSVGHAAFVHKDIPVMDEGRVGIIRRREDNDSEEYENTRGTLQWLNVNINGKNIIIAQFHGLRSHEGKGDIPERIKQSESVRKFVEEKIKAGCEVILCGDFNLSPDTESMRILEGSAESQREEENINEDLRLRNLITDYGVTTTRNKYASNPDEVSDYILVSKGIVVDDFRVDKESDTSDHLPLTLKFH